MIERASAPVAALSSSASAKTYGSSRSVGSRSSRSIPRPPSVAGRAGYRRRGRGRTGGGRL